jgi:uncharacterized protein (TIGR03435 family)
MRSIGKVVVLSILTATASIALLRGQASNNTSSAENPSFEVASIKPNRSPARSERYGLSDGTFNATNTILNLIRIAYGEPGVPLNTNQVSGGPEWIKSEFFDIQAKVDDSTVRGKWTRISTDQRIRESLLMLRSLLTDRFKLKLTHKIKELPVYALILAKKGPLFSEDETHVNNGGSQMLQGHFQMQSGTLDDFVFTLSVLPDLGGRPVLNKIDLRGHYSLTFDFSPYMTGEFSQLADPSSVPSLFTALQERLGLRLEATKASVDTIVIDHIEEPTPN